MDIPNLYFAYVWICVWERPGRRSSNCRIYYLCD